MTDDTRPSIDAPSTATTRRSWLKALVASGVFSASGAVTASAERTDIKQIGAGSIAHVQPDDSGAAPRDIYATDDLSAPYPSSDWWTTLLWRPLSEYKCPACGTQPIKWAALLEAIWSLSSGDEI
jgi:hypothetical protein